MDSVIMTQSKRHKVIDALQNNPVVSVLIIGGGINGAGVFRDLALQGVDVLLVDKGDFCSGTSAASSHKAHGGIRYLENGEFGLVREAVRERNRLINNAPHYVRPLPNTIPIFKWFSGLLNGPFKFFGILDKPAERGALVIKIGLWIYDKYTRAQGTLPRHRFAFRQQSLAEIPQINPDILCTATYYDGAILAPERICLELITDAESSEPRARAINYLSAEHACGDSVIMRDGPTGRAVTVQPRIVINAAGPWVDLVNGALHIETSLIGGTKGSHLILKHAELSAAIGEREFFFENDDGRVVLILPLHDKVLVGTSDLPHDSLDGVRCTEEEVNYFLKMICKVFPTIRVDRSHIIFRFAGVRPLPVSNAMTPGQISRNHHVKVVMEGTGLQFPVYCLIGGKWTTFRSFSEHVANRALACLDMIRTRSTCNQAIGGGANYPCTESERKIWMQDIRKKTRLSSRRLETLFERYGTRAAEVASFIAAQTDHPLRYHPDYSQREIAFLAMREKVVHMDDLVLRRTPLAIKGELNYALVSELAEALGDALNWPATLRESEVKRTCALLADRHSVHLS